MDPPRRWSVPLGLATGVFDATAVSSAATKFSRRRANKGDFMPQARQGKSHPRVGAVFLARRSQRLKQP